MNPTADAKYTRCSGYCESLPAIVSVLLAACPANSHEGKWAARNHHRPACRFFPRFVSTRVGQAFSDCCRPQRTVEFLFKVSGGRSARSPTSTAPSGLGRFQEANAQVCAANKENPQRFVVQTGSGLSRRIYRLNDQVIPPQGDSPPKQARSSWLIGWYRRSKK